MLFSFLGLFLAVVLSSVLLWYSTLGYDKSRYTFAGIIGVLLSVCTAIGLITFFVLAWEYKAAEYKVAILNKEYGTAYTASDVFYAHDVIDAIRELDRKRVEVNGNIFKKE